MPSNLLDEYDDRTHDDLRDEVQESLDSSEITQEQADERLREIEQDEDAYLSESEAVAEDRERREESSADDWDNDSE